jgi:hypothetical protein
MATSRRRLATSAVGILAGVAVLVLVALAETAAATVPPKNCGMMSVEGRRYQVKADQLRCRTAKAYTRRYLAYGVRPSGFRCRRYAASTALKFRCYRRVRVFFAIKR